MSLATELGLMMKAYADEIGAPNREVLMAIMCNYVALGTIVFESEYKEQLSPEQLRFALTNLVTEYMSRNENLIHDFVADKKNRTVN